MLGATESALEVLDEPRSGGRRLRWLSLLAAALVATVAFTSWAPATSPPGTLTMASADTHTSAVPTSAVSQHGSPPSGPPTSAPGGGDARAFCQVARSYLTRVQTTAVSLTDPAKVKNLFAGAPAVAQLVTSAPPEVRQDVAVLTEAMTGMRAALEAADHDLTELSPTALMTLHSPSVANAIARIDAWTRRAC